MAKYEFKCKVCAQKETIKIAIKKYDGYAGKDCDYCQGELVRVIGANPVHYRGTGWGDKDEH